VTQTSDLSKQLVTSFIKYLPADINGLPKSLDSLYREAKSSFSCGHYTACTMLCRKMIMNAAVKEGAVVGLNFAAYVDFIVNTNLLSKKMKPALTRLRKHGNIANHDIKSSTKRQAEECIRITRLMLEQVFIVTGK